MDNALFDYKEASKSLRVPDEIMRDLETQARREFPDDAMLMELHVLRALRAYASNKQREIVQ